MSETQTVEQAKNAFADYLEAGIVRPETLRAERIAELFEACLAAVRAEERQQRDALRSELVRAEAIIAAWVGEGVAFMDTPEAIRELVRAEFLGRDAKEFVPCAVFDEPLDCIRVVTRDCSVTEWRVNDLMTVLEDNYPASPSRKYVGFTIKGARYLCQENSIPLSAPIRLSDVLDAVLRVSPEMVVQFAVNAIARPMVEEVDRVDLKPQLIEGQQVTVMSARGAVSRTIVRLLGGVVIVGSEEDYEAAKTGHISRFCVGFPLVDVVTNNPGIGGTPAMAAGLSKEQP